MKESLENPSRSIYDFIEKKPHPAKAVLNRHQIPVGAVARYCGCTYPYACGVLTGTYPPSKAIEAKLQKIVAELEGWAN